MKYSCNWGNLMYVIEKANKINAVEIEACVESINVKYGTRYNMEISNYAKMKKNERKMYSFFIMRENDL